MKTVSVNIKCPNCGRKASFHSKLIGTYKLYPDPDGYITCTHCGINKEYHFTSKDYYYQIEVGNRVLYAESLDKLRTIKKYFELHYKDKEYRIEPNLDFPKEFYLNKDEIIKKINQIIEKEKDSH